MSTTSTSDVEVLGKKWKVAEIQGSVGCAKLGAFLRTSELSSDDVKNISRERLERVLFKAEIGGTGFSLRQPMGVG